MTDVSSGRSATDDVAPPHGGARRMGLVARRVNAMSPRRHVVVGCAVFVGVLHWVYIHRITPVWQEFPADAPATRALAAIALAVLPALWLPIAVRRPSEVLYWILYLVPYVPTVLIVAQASGQSTPRIFVFLLTLAGCFGGLRLAHLVKPLRVSTVAVPSPVYWFAISVVLVIGYGYLASRFSLSLDISSITDVYDTRAEYKETRAGSSALVAYAVNFIAYVINPLVIGYGLVHRKMQFLIAGVTGQLLIFSFTGFKQVFFSALLMLGLIIVLKRGAGRFGPAMVAAAVVLIGSAVILDSVVGAIVYENIFVRRLFATPGLNSAQYFDFFTANPKANLGHSVLAGVTDYPYDLAPSELIGREYKGSIGSANANLWADAFANFGVPGMVAFTVLIGLVFWVYDSATRSVDIRNAALLLVVPGFGLVNAALLSTLQSHGLGLAVLLGFVALKRNRVRPVVDG